MSHKLKPKDEGKPRQDNGQQCYDEDANAPLHAPDKCLFKED